MFNILFWIYLVNAILLINHEIDSAYWKEWNLFKLKMGISGFILIHFPLLFIVLYGMVLVYENLFAGLIASLLIGFSGLFAFFVHMYFLQKGREEFNTPVSLFILYSVLIVSAAQVIITFILII